MTFQSTVVVVAVIAGTVQSTVAVVADAAEAVQSIAAIVAEAVRRLLGLWLKAPGDIEDSLLK